MQSEKKTNNVICQFISAMKRSLLFWDRMIWISYFKDSALCTINYSMRVCVFACINIKQRCSGNAHLLFIIFLFLESNMFWGLLFSFRDNILMWNTFNSIPLKIHRFARSARADGRAGGQARSKRVAENWYQLKYWPINQSCYNKFSV